MSKSFPKPQKKLARREDEESVESDRIINENMFSR